MSAVPTYRPGGTSSQTQEGGCCCWLSGSRMSTSLRHAPCRLARSRCCLFLGVKRPNAHNDDWSPGPFRDLAERAAICLDFAPALLPQQSPLKVPAFPPI